MRERAIAAFSESKAYAGLRGDQGGRPKPVARGRALLWTIGMVLGIPAAAAPSAGGVSGPDLSHLVDAAGDAAPGWDVVTLSPGFVLPTPRVPADFRDRIQALRAELPRARFASEPSWSGEFAAGALRPDALQKTLALHNLYRFSVGVPEVALDGEWNDIAQHGAVLDASLDRVVHTPLYPEGSGMDRAFYERGYLGTSTSNLHSGPEATGLFDAIYGQMDDSYGTNLETLGHRTALIDPTLAKVGYGQAGRIVAIRTLAGGRDGHRQTDLAAWVWPSAGWVPVDMISGREAWSISLNPAAFPGGKVRSGTDTRVTITRERDGRTWSYCPSCREGATSFRVVAPPNGPVLLICKPDDAGLILSGDSYHVQVSGLEDGTGAPIALGYRTAFFSPEIGAIDLPKSAPQKQPIIAVEWQSQGSSETHAAVSTVSSGPRGFDVGFSSARPLVAVRLAIVTPEGVLPVALQINGAPTLFAPGQWARAADGSPIRAFRLVYGGRYHDLDFVGFVNGAWTGPISPSQPWQLDVSPGVYSGFRFFLRW